MVLIFLLVFQTLNALKCTQFDNDLIEIYATPNESIIINYDDIFKIQDYTKVEIADLYQVITDIKPIQILQEQEYDSSELVSLVTLKEDFTEDWQNKFAALKKNGIQYEIELSINSFSRMPNFNKKSNKISADICFDLAFYSSTLIGVDCMLVEQNDGIQNILYIWNIEQETFTSVENPNPVGYTEATKRKLKSSNQDIYRASLYDPKYPQFDSILEVFAQNGSIIYSLNSTILQNLISKDYQLQIIDFVVSRMGQVSLLNKNGDILIMNYNRKEEDWILLHKFSHEGASAFDFDFKRNSYAVILNEKVIYQSIQNLYTYNLEFTADQIHITNDHILVEFQKQLVYSFDQELGIIHQADFQGKYKLLIVDQTQNDILVVQSTKLQRFQLNLFHSFQFFSKEVNYDRQTSQIIQNLPDQTICKLMIQHTTVDFNNEAIYISDLSENIISQHITTYPFEQHLKINNLKLYGSNIELKFGEIKNDKIILKLTAQKYRTIQLLQNSEAPNFIKIANSENRNFIVKQYNKTTTKISICDVDYSSCIEDSGSFELKVLNSATSLLWTGSNGIFFGDAYDNTFEIHFFQQSQKFQSYGIQLVDSITSIAFNGEIFAALSGNTIYCYYISSIDSLFLFKLNSDTFKNLGITDWDPNQIVANSQSQDLYIINKNRTQLILMKCRLTGYRIINIFGFQESQIEKVLVFENSFAIQFSKEIQLYNKKQETNIFKYKSFSIQTNAKIVEYSYSGFIYIESDKNLLVYNINKININSLYASIEIRENQQYSADQNYLLLNDTNMINFYRDVQIFCQITATDINFIENFTLTTKIENDKQEVIINSPLYIQNSHTSLFLNSNAENLIHKFDRKKQENLWQSISNEWIKGTIIDINMSCLECGKEIQLTKYLQKQNQIILSTLDFKDINSNYMMLLFSDEFEILDKQNYSSYAKYQFSEYNKCTKIMYITENRFIFQCTNIDNKLCLLSWQKQETKFVEDKESFLVNQNLVQIDIYNKQKLILVEKYQIEFMDCGSENFTFSQCQSIQKQQINDQYLAINKAISSIQLFTFENQLVITTFDAEKFRITKQEFIDLEEIVEAAGYYYQQTDWVQMLILNSLETQTEQNQQYLFIAKTGIHYQIQVKWNDQKIASTISSVLQGYGDWEAVGAISRLNWTAIEYKKNEERVVTLYNINNKKVTTAVGGLNYDQKFKTISYDFISEYNNEEQIHFLSTDTDDGKNLRMFQLNEQLKLLIDGKIETQQVGFTITNDFDMIEQSIKFEITYNYYKFWGIWLLVAIIVICCLIAIFWWRKRKTEKKAKKVYLLE